MELSESKSKQIKLDFEQKSLLTAMLNNMAVEIAKCYKQAIKYAHESAGITPEQFSQDISQRGHIRRSNNTFQPLLTLEGKNDFEKNSESSNPYADIDAMVFLKYLWQTRLEKGGYSNYNKPFFRKFNIPPKKLANGIAWCADEKLNALVNNAVTRRNNGAHLRDSSISKATAESLYQGYEQLCELLKYLQGNAEWAEEHPDVKSIPKIYENEFNIICAKPLTPREAAQVVFTTENPSQKQIDAVNSFVLECRGLCELIGGKIYKFGPTAQTMCRMVSAENKTPEEASKEIVRAKQVNVTNAPPRPMMAANAEVLKSAGTFFSITQPVFKALCDEFVLIADESAFLSEAGRSLFTNKLCAGSSSINIDSSTVSALFHRFRQTNPPSEMQLLLDGIPPEKVNGVIEKAQEKHKAFKNAIKCMSFLRSQNHLQIAISPTESEDSHENILQTVANYPNHRFLIFTDGGAEARELAASLLSLPTKNAAVVKLSDIDPDHLVVIGGAEGREVYKGLLENISTEPDSSDEAEEKDLNMATVWRDLPEANVILSKLIGSGGEGDIYFVANSEYIAKCYHTKYRDDAHRQKIEAMLEVNPNIPELCWPVAVMKDNAGEFTGFLMPKAEGKELAETVFHPGRNGQNITETCGWTRKSLATIALNIAIVFDKMHAKNIMMGDVNPRNILVAKDCRVAFVDCDSYQFGRFRCKVGTPLYTPPQIHRKMQTNQAIDYGYYRTRDDELYSLAVLLFEVLFLGKSPYARSGENTDNDVVDAIIKGDFPYPFKTDDDDEKNRPKNAPVGVWRAIWSNLPYKLKSDFIEVFKKNKRISSKQWIVDLQDFIELIDKGKSSDEVWLTEYKTVEGSEMVPLTCEICGVNFNQAKELYERNQAERADCLCPRCRTQKVNFQKRRRITVCDDCGDEFETTVYNWLRYSQKGRKLLCPNCLNNGKPLVTCSNCGATFRMAKEKKEALERRGQNLLCNPCRNTIFHKN